MTTLADITEDKLQNLVRRLHDAAFNSLGSDQDLVTYDDVGRVAGELQKMIPAVMLALRMVGELDKLGRDHFEERIFNAYYISTIQRDEKTGWLFPVNCVSKDVFLMRSPENPKFYYDDNVQAAWEGYKMAFRVVEI